MTRRTTAKLQAEKLARMRVLMQHSHRRENAVFTKARRDRASRKVRNAIARASRRGNR